MAEGREETHKEPWDIVLPLPIVDKIVDKLHEKY